MKRLVIISGMPAVGKTSAAKAIASEFGLSYYSGGDLLKELAVRHGYSMGGEEWWDTKEGLSFLAKRRGDFSFDRQVDRLMVERAEAGNVVLSSYTLPWLMDKGIKIWLKASQDTRAKRMANRDGISLEEAKKAIMARDEENKKLYKELYGIRLEEDLSVFDFVINTEGMGKEAVAKVLCTILRCLA